MKQKEKKARNRRTNEQIDKEVISELEKLVAEYGFGNVNLSALMKAANIEANVFYRSEERRVGKECRSRWSPYH